jgi:hypothetical protein
MGRKVKWNNTMYISNVPTPHQESSCVQYCIPVPKLLATVVQLGLKMQCQRCNLHFPLYSTVNTVHLQQMVKRYLFSGSVCHHCYMHHRLLKQFYYIWKGAGGEGVRLCETLGCHINPFW